MEFQADEKYERLLLQTLIHIQTHLDGDLTLDTLAGHAGFSSHHFHRIFTEFVGEPLRQHVRRLRLEHSAYRLKISEDTILRIALDVGYASHEAFSRAFKQQFGVTPSAFRHNFLEVAGRRHDRRTTTNSANYDGPQSVDGARPPVRLERVRPILVAFIRHTGPYDAILEPSSPLASLWDTLFNWARARGLVTEETLILGIPQDDPTVTPPERQRFDVAIHVPFFREPQDNVGLQTLSPGLYAVGRHYGSFDDLADTYAHIYASMVASGKYRLRPVAPFEVYAHSRVKDDLDIHYTDIYMPVEPAKPAKYGG
jgi:AraC family transcriptional regulator